MSSPSITPNNYHHFNFKYHHIIYTGGVAIKCYGLFTTAGDATSEAVMLVKEDIVHFTTRKGNPGYHA